MVFFHPFVSLSHWIDGVGVKVKTLFVARYIGLLLIVPFWVHDIRYCLLHIVTVVHKLVGYVIVAVALGTEQVTDTEIAGKVFPPWLT